MELEENQTTSIEPPKANQTIVFNTTINLEDHHYVRSIIIIVLISAILTIILIIAALFLRVYVIRRKVSKPNATAFFENQMCEML